MAQGEVCPHNHPFPDLGDHCPAGIHSEGGHRKRTAGLCLVFVEGVAVSAGILHPKVLEGVRLKKS